MDLTDTVSEPTAFDDEPTAPRDPRRAVACFAVCLLAAAAVFFVARSEHAEPAAPTRTAPRSTTLPAARRQEPSPRRDLAPKHGATPVPSQSNGSGRPGEAGVGFFDTLFGSRLEGVYGQPDTVPDAPQPAPDDGPDRAPGGDTSSDGGLQSVGGRDFSVRYPDDWVVTADGTAVTVAPADDAGGVAISATGTPPEGYRFEQLANQWEAVARDRLLPDLQVLERGAFSTGGLDGFRVRYTGTVEGEALQGEMWWLGDGDSVWVLAQGFTAGDSALAATCNGIARSFRPAPRT